MDKSTMVAKYCVGIVAEKIEHLLETRFLTCITIILIAGALLRVVLICLTTSPTETLSRLYPGYTDGEDYSNIARSLVETGVYGYAGRPSALRPPGYPLLIALLWKIFGVTLTAVRFFQIVLFAIMTTLYTHATLKYFGKFAAALTAVGFSVYPVFLFMTTEIATETLYMTLASIVFALTFMILDNEREIKNSMIMAFGAGLSCGAGILTRPNMLFVFVVLSAVFVWRAFRGGEQARRWVICFVGFWIGTLFIVTPWLIRNELQLGSPVLTTNLQYNFFRGTFDLLDGIPNGQSIFAVFKDNEVMYEDKMEDPKNTKLPLSELANEQNARAAAFRIIRADPILWLKERGKNLAYLWLNLQWDQSILEKRPGLVVAAVWLRIVYYVLLIAAIVGSVWIWRHDISIEQCSFVAVAWLFMLAATTVVITFVGQRYRVAMIDPYLIVLACAAIGSWLTRSRRPVLAE